MRYTTLMLAAACAALPTGLAAQGTTGRTTADARVSAAIEAAAGKGIPTALLERKVAEGKAKGIPMERIATAVEQRLAALERARTALAQGGVTAATQGELAVAADAVQAGVSESAIASVTGSAPAERRTVALSVLGTLVAQGQASDRALTQVQAALARGPEALANLPVSVGAEAGAGATGGVTAGTPAGGVTAGVGGRVEVGASGRP